MTRVRIRAALLTLFAVFALVVAVSTAPQPQAKPELALKSAMDKELVDRDPKAAIDLYRKLVTSADRAVAAQAWLHIAQCYEKLGSAQNDEARKAYEQLVRGFADQKDLVTQAQARLEALGGAVGRADTRTSSERVWEVPDGRNIWGKPSPDGRHVTFIHRPSDGTGVWVRDLPAGQDRQAIPHSPKGGAATLPVLFSPNGRQIAYNWYGEGNDSELRIIGVDGTGMRVVADLRARLNNPGVSVVWPRAWSPDAKQILVVVRSKTAPVISVVLVSATDGSVHTVKSIPGSDNVGDEYEFSPDGKYVVFSKDMKELFVSAVDGASAVPLIEPATKNVKAAWTPDGRNILFLSDRSGVLSVWSGAVRDGRPDGAPVLVRPIDRSASPIGFTRDGSLLYQTAIQQADIYLTDLEPTTGQITSTPQRFNQAFVGSSAGPARWSFDGRFLAYTRGSKFVIQPATGGTERELDLAPSCAGGCSPVQWFPDGQSLLAVDFAPGNRAFHAVDAQTGAQRVFFSRPPQGVWQGVLSPDGRVFFYVDQDRLIARTLSNSVDKDICRVDGLANAPKLSPDGRQLAFALWNAADPATPSEGRVGRLMTVSADGGAPRELSRTTLALGAIAWMRDGRHLLVVQPNASSGLQELWSYPVDGGDPVAAGLSLQIIGNPDVHPDGRRLAFAGRTVKQEMWVIRNLLPTAAAAGGKAPQ